MKPLLSVQYLRAIAALAVVTFHSENAAPLGQCGVDVFFVISGFIMWSVTTNPLGPGEFLCHRLIRIVPLYWIATLVMALHLHSDAWDIVRSLLFWPYRRATDGEIWPILVQGWTLNFEMFFYLLFAAALLVPRRFRLLVLSGVIGGLAVIGLAARPADAVLWTYSSPLMFEFLFGVWIAELTLHATIPSLPGALAMIAVSLAAFAMTIGDYTPKLWRFAIWGVPGALLVWGAIALEWRGTMPRIPLLKLLGDSSYSIYLFHAFVLKTAAKPLAAFPAPVAVLGVLAAGALIGIAACFLLEAPVTAWLRRHAGRPRATRIMTRPLVHERGPCCR